MEITWQTLMLILGIGGGITGLISFFVSQKRAIQKAAVADISLNKEQDAKIEVLTEKIRSMQVEITEIKAYNVNLENKIFGAIDNLSKKVDNLIQTLINK